MPNMQGRLPKQAEEEYLLQTGWYQTSTDASTNSWSNDDELFVCSRCKEHGYNCQYDVVQGVNDHIGTWLRLNQCRECKRDSRKQGCSTVKKGALARYRWSDGWELDRALGSEECGRGTRRNPKGTVGAMAVERPRRKQPQRQVEPQFDLDFDDPGQLSDHGPAPPVRSHRASSSSIRSSGSEFNDQGLPNPPSPSTSTQSQTPTPRHSNPSTPTGAADIVPSDFPQGLYQSLDQNAQSSSSTLPANTTQHIHSTAVNPPFSASDLHALLNEVAPRVQWDSTTLAQIDYLHELIDKGLSIESTRSGTAGEGQDRES